jgi:hypothetical protein
MPGATEYPYREYSYDRFGNLTQVAKGNSATDIRQYVPYDASPSTNRLTAALYDTAGNLLSYQGRSYTWDQLG